VGIVTTLELTLTVAVTASAEVMLPVERERETAGVIFPLTTVNVPLFDAVAKSEELEASGVYVTVRESVPTVSALTGMVNAASASPPLLVASAAELV
jgi:hypothetical protein